MNNINFLSIVL